ncbi:hypothetical protein ACSTKM_13640 [Vibrio parahaemolyticus]|uniref:hypothetical protein n=1 Tax=Vibrio parahaemolyticus TaxID=670 RepID=UPI0009CA9544|nr:hypothetical protein [Vibrio parahaemolyticus]EJG1715041.1 hypothetical protein [Vibrio parahaemolyticus]OQK42296.1 hypothetical protein XM71_c10357 [Vibrio parahaemolyticus]
MKNIQHGNAPAGFKWVYTRYRRVRNSTKILDAHAYGWRAWCFLVRCKGGK